MKKVILIFAAVIGVCCAIIGWNYLRDNRLSGFSEESDIYVYPGYTSTQVADSIIAKAAARWPRRLEKVFSEHEVDRYLTPGHYVVKPGQSAAYVARMLNNGWETPVRLTLSGTLRLRGEIARKISNQMMVDSATVRAAMEDRDLLGRFGFTPKTVFALFVPDTYEMYWSASIEEIFAVQKRAYDAFWSDANRSKAAAQKLTPMEVSILASIVSGETNHIPEMPKIAGVYLNRLHKGMKLQADPTIAFCYDYDVKRIYKRQLKFDSPYNTYLHTGLPPGPIYVPSLNALNAVLNPDYGGGNLYFCASPSFDGTHRFARTYSEHLKNAKAFQKALDARQAEKK